MKINYISPSVLPSNSANSVHVIMQCDALVSLGVSVKLYAKRMIRNKSAFMQAVQESYGIDLERMKLVSYYSNSNLADNLKIAIMALFSMHYGDWPDAILSRNLYASYVIAVLERKRLFFETHQLEQGLRKSMQRAIMVCPWVTTIAISRKMIECLYEHHGTYPYHYLVLHDAAPDGVIPLNHNERRSELCRLFPEANGTWQAVCGYFGHLFEGRGIEIINEMAIARPNVLFMVFGGNDKDVQARREATKQRNLIFIGHVPYRTAQQAMRAVDILLMPYQERVSIGLAGQDTARWMSPMKMFEYLACGVPIISSDLPVLREVLKDRVNCLLVEPSEIVAWLSAVDRLVENPHLAMAIGKQAHLNYKSEHTWTLRAKKILDAV